MTQHWIIEVGHSVCRDHNDALMETAGPGPHSTHIVWSPWRLMKHRYTIRTAIRIAWVWSHIVKPITHMRMRNTVTNEIIIRVPAITPY